MILKSRQEYKKEENDLTIKQINTAKKLVL
jgi:hypothetical protein